MSQDLYKLAADRRQALLSELHAGERVLYAGQPDWRAELGKHIAIFLFGLFWSSISFVFFGISAASLLGLHPMMTDGVPAGLGLQLFVFIFSLPFVSIGCAFLSAPYLGMRKSNATVHAITDARLINLYFGADKGCESYRLTTINYVKRHDRSNGTGSLSIGYGVEKDSDGDTRPLTTDWSGIPDAKRAEAIIRDQAKWVR